MAIIKPEEMNFSDNKFSMIISGSPGVGKTTLALSAPKPILIDFDNGISRVKAQHRKDTISAETYEDVLADIESSEINDYETITIDTGGSFVTYLQDWAMRQNPANRKASGGISQSGFGAVKAEFVRFSNHIKYVMRKNVIFVFHTVEEKTKDGEIVQRLMCEGSARNIVWQPCDFGCHVYMDGNNRMAGFSPTDQYFAKGCHGVHGIVRIPALGEKDKNDFLTKLFDSAKKSIADEMKIYQQQLPGYESVLAEGKALIAGICDEATALEASEKIMKLEHQLTSKTELAHMMKARLKEVGLRYDKGAGAYVKDA